MGDFADSLSKVVDNLKQAQEHASSVVQKDMISTLIESFQTGNQQIFKKAQSLWVQDRSPVVESVIGFIETYQDPHGIRGAWEGIVAVVNKVQSKKFTRLVERSSDFIITLPWNGKSVGLEDGSKSAFETSECIKPDLTSLDSTF